MTQGKDTDDLMQSALRGLKMAQTGIAFLSNRDEMLSSFVDAMLAEKNDPQVTKDNRELVKSFLMRKAEEAAFNRLYDEVTEEKQAAVSELIDNHASLERIYDFFQFEADFPVVSGADAEVGLALRLFREHFLSLPTLVPNDLEWIDTIAKNITSNLNDALTNFIISVQLAEESGGSFPTDEEAAKAFFALEAEFKDAVINYLYNQLPAFEQQRFDGMLEKGISYDQAFDFLKSRLHMFDFYTANALIKLRKQREQQKQTPAPLASPTVLRCQSCGFELQPTNKFCPNCGEKVREQR